MDEDFCEAEFELDFCTCLNMMSGMTYEEAVTKARQDMQDARE